MKLRVDSRGELTVTAPRGVASDEIDVWVAQRQGWVESVRARQAESRSDLDPATRGMRPLRIDLPAINEQWSLNYEQSQSDQLRFQSMNELTRPRRSDTNQEAIKQSISFKLPHASKDELDQRIAARLQKWLRDRASETLTPQIESIAKAHGFDYQSITFRNQRTRWGSCSAKRRLSINARLLLASPGACRYVLIHELVHTEHLNHSPTFWARVAELDPNFRAHENELNQLSHRLPDWL